MKKLILNSIEKLWLVLLIFMLLLLPLALFTIPNYMVSILESGFSTPSVGIVSLSVFSFVFGITMLVPPFRKNFYKYPWLYSCITILMVDTIILAIGVEILNYGYQVKDEARQTMFFWIMVAQLIVSRLLFCVFCHKKPMRLARENNE